MRSIISPVELSVDRYTMMTKVFSESVVKSGSTLTTLTCLRVNKLLSRMRVMTSLGSALPVYSDHKSYFYQIS